MQGSTLLSTGGHIYGTCLTRFQWGTDLHPRRTNGKRYTGHQAARNRRKEIHRTPSRQEQTERDTPDNKPPGTDGKRYTGHQAARNRRKEIHRTPSRQEQTERDTPDTKLPGTDGKRYTGHQAARNRRKEIQRTPSRQEQTERDTPDTKLPGTDGIYLELPMLVGRPRKKTSSTQTWCTEWGQPEQLLDWFF
ncbi:hypothetical protein NDU88_007475 [Pleurodeles waltl]|uniref:Uncharacterized protein n=1 Tax=Pleurodeles waltl TaxID=8319 RepID=A0AAV7LXT6_PLEWA|nr:hypothetical protein NDU88_007475 [Pleurodeles waltl]